MMLFFVSMVVVSRTCHGFSFAATQSARPSTSVRASLSLEEVAAKWITTARNGVALKNINSSYVDESFTVRVERPLGLDLEEMWASKQMFTSDGRRRGLVLVGGVNPGGNSARASSEDGKTIAVGDTLTRIDDVDVEGLDFEAIVEALQQGTGIATLEVQRIVRRELIDVTVLDYDGSLMSKFKLPSGGANLRMALLYNGFRNKEIYDDQTMRFDAIANSGSNCGGEGTCGTCLVNIQEGSDLIAPPARLESAALAKQGRPKRWRWSCRCTVGSENQGGSLVVQLRPQANYQEERDRVVGL